MPTKHIDNETWRKIEKKTVEEIIKSSKSIKEGDMLKRLILIGLKHFDNENDFVKKNDKFENLNRRKEDHAH